MTKSRSTSRFSKFLSLANSIFLLVPLLLFQVVTSSPAHAAACSAGTVTVNPLHSPDGTKRIFYGDLKGGSTVRSSYVGWELTGASGILGNDIWIKLTGINSYSSSGNLRLGQYQDSIFPVRGTSSNGNPQVYAYLTAFTATNTDFDFTVSIYNGYPYASNTAVCEYADGFTQIVDTISASSNTVTSVSISSPIVLGSSFTVTAQGSTGTMGSGEVNDRVSGNGPIVLSPSASDSFRSDAFQLIGVSIAYGGTTYRDELRTYPTTTADTPYTATYTFQVRGVPGSSTTLTPIQSIASGANVKYTGTTYSASISNPTNPLSTTKSVVSKTGTTTPWTVKYKVVISNSGSTSIVVDRVVDAPSAGSWTYISNSTTLDGVAFPDTRVTTSGGKLYFGGPLTVSGNSSITIIYDLSLTASNTNTVGAEYAGGVALGSTSITVNPTVTLTLSPNSPLTSGVVGTSYSQTFSTTGGTSPYTYALASGTLPTGLSLSGATLSGTPTVAGTYTFTIRSTDANNAVVTKDYTLEIKATVTYNGNSNTGGSAPTDGSSPYSVGNSVTVLSNSSPLTRTNYVFTKWNTQSGGGGTDYLPGATFTMSTSNVILYAQWTYETYTVTYQGNGNTGGSAPSAQTKTYGTPLTLSTKGTLTKTGYTFTNWNTASNGSGTTYGSAGTYTANTGTTLYAQWSADTLTVTYNENGGTTPSGGTTTTHTGETLTTLATTSRAGYTFNGWFTAGSGGSQITTSAPHGQTASFTLYAQWSAASQTITYNANGGSGSIAATTGNTDASVTLSDGTGFTRAGYTLSRWDTATAGTGVSYNKSQGITMPAGGLTLYAVWSAASQTITYNANGGSGSIAATTGNTDASVTLSDGTGFTRAGYTLSRWDTATAGTGVSYNKSQGITMPAGGLTLYAVWSAASQTITYNANGGSGSIAATTGNTDASVTLSDGTGFTRAGYTLSRWDTATAGTGVSYNKSQGITMPAGGLTLYAVWSAASQTITYNANGGSGSIAATTGNTDASVTLSDGTGFTRAGYTLSRWDTATAGTGVSYNKSQGITMPAGGLTLYAVWSANDITITFDSNTATSGSMSSLTTKADSSTVLTLNTFSKTSFNFLNWAINPDGSGTTYVDGGDFSGLASLTLYAIWTDKVSVRINYYSNYGTFTDSHQNAIQSTTVTLNANPFTRSGYSFLGWSTDSGTATIVHTESETVVGGFSALTTNLYAQWSADTLTVTYNENGGTTPSGGTTTTHTGETLTTLATTSRAGYTFNGWFTAGSGGSQITTSAPHGQTASFTLYAQWSAASQTITYNANGGSGSIAATTGNTDASVTLSDGTGFTRAGYTLSRWDTATAGTGVSYNKSQGITMPAGGLTLYAVWSAASQTITYNANGGSGSIAATTGNTDASVTLSDGTGFTRAGYTLSRWDTATAGTGVSYNKSQGITMPAGGLTLYAVWSANSLTVTFDPQNGGSTSTASTTTDGNVSDPGTPTYTGHSFNGWFVASSGGSALSFPYTHGQTSNFTLYAQWAGDTVTVTYNGNGKDGGSVPSNQTKTYGVNLTLASNTGNLTRTGYTYGGWNTQSNGNGTPYAEAGTYSANSAVTLYAKWTANDITITFDSNTATSGSMSALNTKADSATVLTSNGFTKSGYSFQYWTEDSGGTGTQYTDASSYSSLTSITLYAQWSTSTTTYTITYDTSTATSGSTTYVTQTYTVGGATLTLNPQGTLARTGYTFGGWKNGVTTYTTAQTGVTLSSSITLEPIWTGITYTVTYNGNGNSSGSAPTSQSFTYGSGSVTISSNSGDLKKSSYTFSTWNTSSAGTGTTYAPGATYSGAASITLYAVWDQNSKRSQSISLSGGTLPYLTSTTLRGTGYSGTGSISYSLNSGNCSISGDQLTAQASSGSCIVTVTIAADSTYNSASNNATFTLVKANQVINFTQPRNMLVGESRQSLTYSASSGLPVTLSNNSSGICSVYTAGTDPERNGTCSITASQGGNANYNPATSVTVTYSISSVVKKQQNLVFNQPSAMLTSDPGQKLFYFSLTTVPIIVTVNTPSICEVRDGVVYPISAGQCSITVSQNGTVEYEPASVTRIFNIVRNQSVAKRQYTLKWSNPAPIYEGTPLTSIQLNAEASISGTYEYTPTFGVKLPRGTYTLLVLFSPTDLGTYTSQTTSVTLLVRAGVSPLPTTTPNPYATVTPSPTATPRATPTPSSSINPLGNGVITVATTPVTTVITQVSNSGTVSVPTPTSSPSPTLTPIPSISPSSTSNPSPTPTPSPTRTSTPNPNSSNSASPNNSQTTRPTPTPVVIKPTPGVTAAPLPTPSIATATPKPTSSSTVVNQGQGIDQVTTTGKEVTVVAEEGYSGKTTVTVTVQDSGQSKKVVIPVTVLPLPAKNPTYQLLSLSKTIVHWGQSDNAYSYRVLIDGVQVCATEDLSCTLNKAYGQNNKVEIISVGGDNLTSKAPAVFDKSQPFLLTVVNFDTAKFSLTTNAKSILKDVATKVRALGYKDFTIYGFTDIRGGIDNQKLSLDRATSVKNYISSLVPGADFQISSYGPSYPVASNSTPQGLAANRRAEIWVTG